MKRCGADSTTGTDVTVNLSTAAATLEELNQLGYVKKVATKKS